MFPYTPERNSHDVVGQKNCTKKRAAPQCNAIIFPHSIKQIIFPHSIKQIIHLRRYCCCRRHFLNSLFLRWQFDPYGCFTFPVTRHQRFFSKLNLSFIRRIEYAEAHVSVKRSGERGGLALILALRWKDTLFMLCYITAMTFNGNKIINNTMIMMLKMTMMTKGVILNFLSVAGQFKLDNTLQNE